MAAVHRAVPVKNPESKPVGIKVVLPELAEDEE